MAMALAPKEFRQKVAILSRKLLHLLGAHEFLEAPEKPLRWIRCDIDLLTIERFSSTEVPVFVIHMPVHKASTFEPLIAFVPIYKYERARLHALKDLLPDARLGWRSDLDKTHIPTARPGGHAHFTETKDAHFVPL